MAGTAMTAPTPVTVHTTIPGGVSATLAVGEALAARRSRGESVLALGFGEAGLPVHPMLRAALSEAAGRNGVTILAWLLTPSGDQQNYQGTADDTINSIQWAP